MQVAEEKTAAPATPVDQDDDSGDDDDDGETLLSLPTPVPPGKSLRERLVEIKDEPAEESSECQICYKNRLNIALDCGHASCCAGCTLKLVDSTNRCPQCRADITGFIRLYL